MKCKELLIIYKELERNLVEMSKNNKEHQTPGNFLFRVVNLLNAHQHVRFKDRHVWAVENENRSNAEE